MEGIFKLFKGDKVVWILFAVLCFISLVEVFSASSTLAYRSHSTFAPIIRHASFLLLGVVVVWIMHQFHFKHFVLLGFIVFFVALTLLILTPLIGVRVNDASRWIELFGIQFQPSEFAKLAMVIFTAFVLSKCQKSVEARDKAFWIIGIVTICFAMLIIRENLSTAIMLCAVVYILMMFGRVSTRKLLVLLIGVVVVVGLFLLLLKLVPEMEGFDRWGTWRNRIFGEKLGVLDPGFEIGKENYQSAHAKMAIANGSFFGVFPGNSTQRDYLPQAYSDFIYAIIIEEMGWIGAIGVPFVYLMLMYRGLRIARRCTKIFPMLLVMGSTMIIGLQAFINMMVAVGAGPVTGQPMPLISRGGTSTLITCIYFGIILSVSRFGVSEDPSAEKDKAYEPDGIETQIHDTSSEYGV